MPTLWEILTKKKQKATPLEFQVFNPLGLRVGNVLKIDLIDFENMLFNLTSLREVKRFINNEEYYFVDYEIQAKPLDGEPVFLRLRLVPTTNKDEYRVLILRNVGSCAYDKEFHEGLAFDKNKGEFVEGDATYYRVDDIQQEWSSTIKFLKDDNHDGTVEDKEVKLSSLTYWDFWRETTDEAQNKILDFYFVEMDDNGFFEFWTGPEIDSERVMVF